MPLDPLPVLGNIENLPRGVAWTFAVNVCKAMALNSLHDVGSVRIVSSFSQGTESGTLLMFIDLAVVPDMGSPTRDIILKHSYRLS